jgi:multidrug efflux pump subunit AcrA (membrane-fusion protein)
MRILKTIILWLVLIGAAYACWKWVVPLFKPDKKETDIQTTEVRRGDLRLVVPADGTIVPRVLVEVKSKASGVIEALNVEAGDVVKTGDIIAVLDSKEILGRKRQAEANLAAAEAQLKLTKRSLSPQQKASAESSVRQAKIAYEDAKARYERIKAVYDKGFATEQEMDDAEKAVTLAKESLEQAEKQLKLDLQGAEPEEIEVAQASVLRNQAELDNVNEELAYTTIRAPQAGTVLTRPVEIGTAVASGTSGMSGGTVVCTIGDLSTLYAKAFIEETDLDKVPLGQPCRITTDAFSGYVWTGKVKKIYPQGETSDTSQWGGSSSARFQVDIAINLASAKQEKGDDGGSRKVAGNSMMFWGPGMGIKGNNKQQKTRDKIAATKPKAPPQLKPQLTASVDIVLEDHPDVLMIPAQYVQFDNDKPYCEVQTDPKDQKKRERRNVETGFSDGLRFEIKSGLKEGETVVLERPVKVEETRRF